MEEGRLNSTDVLEDAFEKYKHGGIHNLILILCVSFVVKVADVTAELFDAVKKVIKIPTWNKIKLSHKTAGITYANSMTENKETFR